MTHILMMNISDITAEDYRRLYLQSDQRRQRKADRYLKWDDRVRCICAGSLLRLGIRRALGKDDYEIETSPFGKPNLKDEPYFHYNLSHAGQRVVIAYGSRPVGIDVEQVHWDSGKENLARRYFTADEQEFVFGQSWQGRAERFFQIWTSKESYLKYIGTGLQKALNSFSVLQMPAPNRFTFQPDGGYSMSLWTEEEAYELEQLSVSDLLNIS